MIRSPMRWKASTRCSLFPMKSPPCAQSRKPEFPSAFACRIAATRIGNDEVVVVAGDEMPEHHLFQCPLDRRMWVHRRDAVDGHAMAVSVGVVGVGPGLHAGVDEDVGMILFEYGVKTTLCGIVRRRPTVALFDTGALPVNH